MSIQERIERIEKTLKQANNPMAPVGQAQSGLQLAQVEVPWLIEQLKMALGLQEETNVVNLEDYRAKHADDSLAAAVGS
jgi:hypothetical protein